VAKYQIKEGGKAMMDLCGREFFLVEVDAVSKEKEKNWSNKKYGDALRGTQGRIGKLK